MTRRRWRIVSAASGIFLAVAAGAVPFLNLRLTHYVESDRFRARLENETAKGLHFPSGHYAPIRRASFATVESERFQASDGKKALKTMDARGLRAKFNPWGIFLRRWELDDVHIQSGEVGIQIYEANPEGVSSKPWFSIFLPNRVYLKHIESEPANVTWQFRGERAGFFGARLLITPHGSDFEYRATGGTLKMALIPDLYLRQMHLLITKTLLTLYDLDFAPSMLADGSDGSIHGAGGVGIGKDKSVDFNVSFDRLPIRGWLPSNWKEHFAGSGAGAVHWTGRNPKLESSAGEGSLRVSGARIDNLPFLEKLAALAQKKSLEHLRLSDCSLDLAWRYPKIEIKNIALEEKGRFRIEGAISIDRGSLGGAIALGVTREYLDWLPKPEEIFTRERGGYLWATVHLSGTIKEPKQDLSPRIVELFKESPGAYLGLLLRELEAWLKRTFNGE